MTTIEPATDADVEACRTAPRDRIAGWAGVRSITVCALVARIDALKARIAELERRKPAKPKFPTASGFPDP